MTIAHNFFKRNFPINDYPDRSKKVEKPDIQTVIQKF